MGKATVSESYCTEEKRTDKMETCNKYGEITIWPTGGGNWRKMLEPRCLSNRVDGGERRRRRRRRRDGREAIRLGYLWAYSTINIHDVRATRGTVQRRPFGSGAGVEVVCTSAFTIGPSP